jgi:hypothetical protein
MCCPIISVISKKELYLIPEKMPPKRYDGNAGNLEIPL